MTKGWACTYRIANFPLGGPDIRSRSRTPRPSLTSLRPTWVGGSFFVRQDRRSPPSSTLPLRPNTRPHYLRCAPIGASGIRRRDDGLGRYRRLPMPRRQNKHPLASRRPVLRARSMASCSVPNGPCHRLSGRHEPFTAFHRCSGCTSPCGHAPCWWDRPHTPSRSSSPLLFFAFIRTIVLYGHR